MLEARSRCWSEIHCDRIAHNVKQIQSLLHKNTKIMAVVKANAYGHGDVRIAQELVKTGIDFFAVSSIDEALHLRQGNITQDILVLGYTPYEHFHYLAEYDIVQTLISKDFALALQEYAQEHGVKIRSHIKVDTGMSRLGIQCKEECWNIDDVIALYQLENITVEGIFSHFSVSDAWDDAEQRAFTQKQIALYDRVLEHVKAAGFHPGITHLQNSYGILNYAELSYDYVRPGLLYLGVTSDDAITVKNPLDFQPIMTWKANVSYVKEVQPGSDVSYGRHFHVSQKMKIATVSCGYADGYPRSVSNLGKEVLVHGKRAKIIGNICMDQMMIDVTDIDVKPNDEVVLFGYDQGTYLSVDELSRMCHTINNETLCWISARVPRIYISSNSR